MEAELDQDISEVILEHLPNLTDSVDCVEDWDLCSSDDKVQAEDFESSLETPEMAMMCVDSPSLSSIWVDLAPVDPELRTSLVLSHMLALFLRYLKLGKHQRLLLVRWGGKSRSLWWCFL